MARPIADTPVLRGKDAVRFMEAMENVKPPFSKEKKEEMKRNYELFKSRATFPLTKNRDVVLLLLMPTAML